MGIRVFPIRLDEKYPLTDYLLFFGNALEKIKPLGEEEYQTGRTGKAVYYAQCSYDSEKVDFFIHEDFKLRVPQISEPKLLTYCFDFEDNLSYSSFIRKYELEFDRLYSGKDKPSSSSFRIRKNDSDEDETILCCFKNENDLSGLEREFCKVYPSGALLKVVKAYGTIATKAYLNNSVPEVQRLKNVVRDRKEAYHSLLREECFGEEIDIAQKEVLKSFSNLTEVILSRRS